VVPIIPALLRLLRNQSLREGLLQIAVETLPRDVAMLCELLQLREGEVDRTLCEVQDQLLGIDWKILEGLV
jgi:hypothetical protein